MVIFKKLRPREGTYELRGHGEKKPLELKNNETLTQPYKNYLQQSYMSP